MFVSLQIAESPTFTACQNCQLKRRQMPTKRRSEVVGICNNGLPFLDPWERRRSSVPEIRAGRCKSGGASCLPRHGGEGGHCNIDAINAAINVLLSASEALQSDMARNCLAWSNVATDHVLPAGMISTGKGAVVEWILLPICRSCKISF